LKATINIKEAIFANGVKLHAQYKEGIDLNSEEIKAMKWFIVYS
jgi:hypothetical protein